MMTPRAQKILEIYRNYPVRTTVSGHRVRWDEPGESDSDEIRRHNAALERARKKRQDAKERLKSKGAVPTKDGKPIFEGNLVVAEDVQFVLSAFRRLYSSNRSMRFRDWIREVQQLLDSLS